MNKIVEFTGLGLKFEFNNVFNIGPITITIYGILIALGLTVALIYGFRNFKRFGVDDNKMIDCIIGGIIGGIIGARLYYVIFTWSDFGFDFSSWSGFWDSILRIFSTWEGGMAIYGGLIGALVVGLIIAKFRKMPIGATLDITGIAFLIGQGIGRWGNFFNVEAFGSNTTLPWGMSSPTITSYLTAKQEQLAILGVNVDPNLPVHPTFLYESLWCILGFFLLHFYSKRRKFDGEVFLMYLAYYGLGRAFIEGLRTDSLMIGYLRISQVLALLLVVVSVLFIIIIRNKIKSNNDPEYLKLYVNSDEWKEFLEQKESSKNSNYDDAETLNTDIENIDDISEIDEDVSIEEDNIENSNEIKDSDVNEISKNNEQLDENFENDENSEENRYKD